MVILLSFVVLSSGQRFQLLATFQLSNPSAGAGQLIFSFEFMLKTTTSDTNHVFEMCRLEDPAICPVLSLESYIRRTKSIITDSDGDFLATVARASQYQVK